MIFSPVAIAVAVLAYAVLLIAIAWRADNAVTAGAAGTGHSPRFRALRYSLSLATICSSWTYFGAIGEAREGSWLYFASGLGPILALTLGFPLWRRVALLAEQENVGSIADFLAARYGKSRTLGQLVAVVSALGALPYFALQLTMLSRVWTFVSGTPRSGSLEALIFVAVLMLLAMAFGTRRPSLTQHSRGMVSMVAVESCVKLLGLVAVAVLCLWLAGREPTTGSRMVAAIPPLSPSLKLPFATAVMLSTLTAFTLPRQFHLGFVTLEKTADVRTARWLVPIYFSIWPLSVLVIGTAVRAGLGATGINPNMQILALPLLHGAPVLSLLALLGGLSAASAMVVVEATAVSAMVSNELILPWLATRNWRDLSRGAAGRSILRVRRATLTATGLLGWLYYVGVHNGIALTHLGFTALAAFAQLFPALVGGIYWPRGHARGAIAGIAGGTLLWGLAIVMPTFLTAFDPWHRPAARAMWLLSESWPFQVALYASLALNTLLYVAISMRATPRLIDTIQADTFVGPSRRDRLPDTRALHGTAGDLRALLTQFVGEQDADRTLRDQSTWGQNRPVTDDLPISPAMARAAERSLAGVVGAPSARNLVAIALAADSQDASEISRILDEAAHAVHFSRELLQTILDTLDQAVGVLDADLCLVAWNGHYLRLMGIPVDRVYVGKPLMELFGEEPAQADTAAARRFITGHLGAVEHRSRMQGELLLASGRALRATGIPLDGADYLTSFVDITDLKAAERVLASSNEELEERVHQRTAELTAVNAALDGARQLAERVTGAQGRFVAAASHDLVQPLHAARLFIGTALAGPGTDATLAALLERADHSVEAAHRLLRALLHLSQLEVGVLEPKREPVDAGLLLMSLFEEFTAQAEARGLELVVMPTSAWVLSDPDLLRSMLQNLVLNAIRYTPGGRVVVACRRAGGQMRFEVRDSGVGIAPDALPAAFKEFRRLADGEAMAEGVGLGLSIVARISKVLDHPVSARSRLGVGSVFAIAVPAADRGVVAPTRPVSHDDLDGLRVLCVDDEPEILAGTTALIERWGGRVTPASSAEAIEASSGRWDVALADLRLGGDSGLVLLRRLKDHVPLRFLVTATPTEGLEEQLAGEGIGVFTKPIGALALRAALAAACVKSREISSRSAPAPATSIASGSEPLVS